MPGIILDRCNKLFSLYVAKSLYLWLMAKGDVRCVNIVSVCNLRLYAKLSRKILSFHAKGNYWNKIIARYWLTIYTRKTFILSGEILCSCVQGWWDHRHKDITETSLWRYTGCIETCLHCSTWIYKILVFLAMQIILYQVQELFLIK